MCTSLSGSRLGRLRRKHPETPFALSSAVKLSHGKAPVEQAEIRPIPTGEPSGLMQTQPDNQKNLLLAILLSMGILVGWQYFYAGPKLKDEQERQRVLKEKDLATKGATGPATTTGTPSVPGAPSVPGGTPGAAPATSGVSGALSRQEALKLNPRTLVETPTLNGSISLKGGRIDDLTLTKYHETVDPKSPQIVLLSPLEGQKGYFAEYGWLNPPGAAHKLPNSDTVWTLERGQKLTPAAPVTLAWDNGGGLVFRRTISVDDNYMFKIADEVENKTGAEIALSSYARLYRFGTPHTEGYYIQHEGLVGIAGEDGLKEFTYADAQKEAAKDGFRKAFENKTGGWLGMTDKYWSAVLIPPQQASSTTTYNAAKATGDRKELFFVDYALLPVKAAAGQKASVEANLFAGAKQVSLIESYGDALKITKFNYMIDWGWFYFITIPMFHLINWLYQLIGNFGLAILAVTVIVKAAFFPLANKAYESMAKMKKLQPDMERIRGQYKDDKAAQQKALMELYAKQKINPLAGCLPILLQIPVFFALYKTLFITLDMRHAPFFGWIKDLSAPDPTSFSNIFGLLPYAPLEPYLLGFTLGVWPIIMGITMWLQMQLNPQQPDPTQQMIFNWMPVMFTFMLGGFASGLVIYWAWNNLLSLIQQYYIMKKQGTEVPLVDNLKRIFGGKKKD